MRLGQPSSQPQGGAGRGPDTQVRKKSRTPVKEIGLGTRRAGLANEAWYWHIFGAPSALVGIFCPKGQRQHKGRERCGAGLPAIIKHLPKTHERTGEQPNVQRATSSPVVPIAPWGLSTTKGLEPYPKVHFQNSKALSGSQSRKSLYQASPPCALPSLASSGFQAAVQVQQVSPCSRCLHVLGSPLPSSRTDPHHIHRALLCSPGAGWSKGEDMVGNRDPVDHENS